MVGKLSADDSINYFFLFFQEKKPVLPKELDISAVLIVRTVHSF